MIGSNFFYNGETAGGNGIGNSQFFNQPGSVNNSQGLSAGQLADAKFYANGTINQVLADRATAAAAAQAQAAAVAPAAATQQAASAAIVAGTTDARTSAETPPTSAMSAAGTRAVAALGSPGVEDNIKNIENNIKSEDHRRRRRIAATTTTSHHTSHRSGNPGATIRTIDVDGQRFNLQNGTPKPDAPAQPPH